MSNWRRRALALFPDLRDEIQDGCANIYTVFFALLPRCREAHRDGDEAELEKIYSYAAWCSRHKARNLWNAAGVCFWEHLPDDAQTKAQMDKRIPPDVFASVVQLLQARMEAEEFAQLKKQFDENS